jgi:hypothetical protein
VRPKPKKGKIFTRISWTLDSPPPTVDNADLPHCKHGPSCLFDTPSRCCLQGRVGRYSACVSRGRRERKERERGRKGVCGVCGRVRLAQPLRDLSSATVEGAGKAGSGEGRDAGLAEPVRRSRRGSCKRDPKQPSVSSTKIKWTGGWGKRFYEEKLA